MATVTVFTAARMKVIEDSTVVTGYIDSGHHLILQKRDGTLIDAGDVSAISTMSVEDSASIDLTLTGSGTPAAPWKLKAEIIKVDGSLITMGTIPDQTSTALLDASYRGTNKSKVALAPGGALSTDAYPWMTPYNPQGSRQVRLIRAGSSFQIAGQTMDDKYPVTLGPSWYTYNDLTAQNLWNDRIVANKLASGLVVLSGMIRNVGTPADTSVVMTLPPELAPDSRILLPVMISDVTYSLQINPDGKVQVYGTWPSAPSVYLDGITFFAAGSVSWTPVGQGGSSFGPNFEAWSDTATWGVPKFYKDPYGVVWFQGLVRVKVATSTDNTNMILLPATHRADFQQHFRGSTYPGYSGLGAIPTDGLNWKLNSPGTVGQYISITGASIITPDAVAKNIWRQIPSFSNSWGLYSPASFGPASYTRREDGLCMTRGMITSGSIGFYAFVVPAELQPAGGKSILMTISNNATARLDISSPREGGSLPGSFVPVSGSNSWYSLDGLKWVP